MVVTRVRVEQCAANFPSNSFVYCVFYYFTPLDSKCSQIHCAFSLGEGKRKESTGERINWIAGHLLLFSTAAIKVQWYGRRSIEWINEWVTECRVSCCDCHVLDTTQTSRSCSRIRVRARHIQRLPLHPHKYKTEYYSSAAADRGISTLPHIFSGVGSYGKFLHRGAFNASPVPVLSYW